MIGLVVLLLAAVPENPPPSPLPPDTQALLALRAVEHGRPLQAQVMLDRLATQHAQADPHLIGRVQAKLALGDQDYAGAEKGFEQLLVQDANDCDALEGAGIAAAHLERDETARAYLQRAVAHCVASWQGWNTLGVIADHASRWQDAADAYAHARTLAPIEPAILNNIGYSLTLQHRFPEAEAVLREARTLSPDNQRMQNNLDVATVAGGATLDQSNGNEPDAERARRLNNAGYVALVEGRDGEAQAYLAASLNLAPLFSDRTANNLRLIKQGGGDAH
ncbi:MAG TPA: hypothetical protein VKQ09_05160 [Sphingomonas sp.]|nr:hypothetical protein [Sphingomonas sp.]